MVSDRLLSSFDILGLWTDALLIYSRSHEEAKSSISNLNADVQKIVESSECLSRKLARTDYLGPESRCYADPTISSLPETNDATSTICLESPSIAREQASSILKLPRMEQFDPEVELQLCKSRVYMRAANNHSMSSLLSTSRSTPGWSFFSGLSLSQISNMSIIMLPIKYEEIWNSQHYADPTGKPRLNILLLGE